MAAQEGWLMRSVAVLGLGALLLISGAPQGVAQNATPRQAQGQQNQGPRLLAPTSQPVTAVAGAWEISAESGEKKCRVQLNARETKERRMILGAPPACKTAMPLLTMATQWALGEDGAIYLFKQDGGQLYLFRRDAAGSFKAESGVDLALEPVGGRASEAPRSESVAATLNALNGQAPAKDADRAALTGAYALARSRSGGEDCTLELNRMPGPRPKSGGAVWTAALDAGCADEGLRIFEPVGWQYDNGRIFLLAKKGSTIGFTRDGQGWRKDPAAGRPLWLMRK